MPQTRETRRAGGAAGLGNVDLRAANDVRDNVSNAKKVQEIIAHLQRDFAAEALRVVAIKAAHAADDVMLGDDHGAEREIRLAISHLRAGSAAFRELRDSIGHRVSGEAER
jgi:hypothetical protein